ncbi:N-acetylglucosaminyl transferase component-domain-containing protein [Lentinula boryana]|uniref:N-acetylglucosaminyl transferase component-domain-containing protein n=1 Tax=Lentinula boryana TaxID=40481 RepID=A0ABQ8Q7Y1_9AGAR|nr:N-acetylglucosaminyl transferase component-domain-containing protein [Lentinula boryana]
MSASLYNPSASVFWPLDCKESGYAFGWCNNNQNVVCIVVAGVIQLHTVDSKLREGLPKLLEHTQQHTDIADLGELQLIGKCTFYSGQRKGLVAPELEIGQATKYSIVFYHRHQAQTLRFYLMDTLGLEIDAFNVTSSSTVRPASGQKSSGISQHIVNQLNVASIINAAILDSLSSMSNATPSSTNLRRTTKSITARTSDLLETAISISQSFISMPIQVICNIHVSAKYLLKDVSLSVQQMDVRADQSAALLRQMAALQSRREGVRIEIYSMKYTSFFNTVWLILNDVTIGYAFGKFLCENHEVLSGMLKDAVENSLISWPQRALCWLDSWPAGLKLNTELSRFYSGTFVDLVDIWGGVLRHTIFPQLPNIIYIFGLISSFGALIVLTLHIYVCYAIAVLAYERALWGLGSLWRLFRGKRFNVLRNRTDSWEYDIDQLLFGTILFTLLAFLFPTVLAYYALFALLRLATILIQASLEIQLAFMNHFPLFALVLKLKDPWRLPGGLCFDFVRVSVHINEHEAAGAGTDEHFITTLIPIVENQPVTLGRIFFQYTRLWTKLASHYHPFRLFKSLLLGRFLVPIPRFD